MADNSKPKRITLSQISARRSLEGDLYCDDFLLHPRNIAIREEDLEIFKAWQIKEFELCGASADSIKDPDMATSALSNGLDIMQQDIADMQQAQELHRAICNFITGSYQTVNKQQRFAPEEPAHTVKCLIESVRRTGSPILRFQEFQVAGSPIELCAVNSFILTVALAHAAKMPQHRLLNLAIAAVFHKVGMVKYANLFHKDHPLTNKEFEQQKAHVREGLDLLNPYDFSLEVIEGIAHHHERLDGSGYPRGLAAAEISSFGRYLGLVTSYVDMTVEQKFRKSHLPHSVLLTILKGAKVLYDADLVRLLVQLLSLYPVGSYVILSNGATGRVLRNNPQNPRLPVVQLLLGPDQKPVNGTVIQTNEKIQVARPVSYKKIASVIQKLYQSL